MSFRKIKPYNGDFIVWCEYDEETDTTHIYSTNSPFWRDFFK